MHNTVRFNESQSKAISHGAGPMLVIAGPGSGKTLVITHRIYNLIKEHKVRPENILVITFTKAAAIEMQYRFCALTENKISGVNFGTCHAIFYQILREANISNGNKILSEYEKREIMEYIIQNNKDSSFEPNEDAILKLISEISKVKNTGIKAADYECPYCSQKEFYEIYSKYNKICHERNSIDFDDMLSMSLTILETNHMILSKYQKLYQYILVDEFQDINPVQYKIIKLLSGERQNLFVVGDDDQSIYGFRGATPNIMKSFREDFMSAIQVELNHNYRSKKEIVDTSIRLINHNDNRFIKAPIAEDEIKNRVKYFSYESREEQYNNLVLCIESFLKKDNTSVNDIAVLYRTNGHASLLIPELVKKAIPFKCKETIKNIYQTEIGKDIIAYIAFSFNQEDLKSFFRIMNRPVRYIKRSQIPINNFCKNSIINSFDKEDYVLHKILHFFDNMDFIKELEPYPAINYIRKGIGYDNYLEEYCRNNNKNFEEELLILEEITKASKSFNSLDKWLRFVNNYEATIKKGYSTKDGITIMTMHGSKGLEWPFIIIPDLNEGVIPHKKARTIEQLEEERRIFYVGMTRAKDYLYFFYVNSKKADLVGQPSRFLTECFIPD